MHFTGLYFHTIPDIFYFFFYCTKVLPNVLLFQIEYLFKNTKHTIVPNILNTHFRILLFSVQLLLLLIYSLNRLGKYSS